MRIVQVPRSGSAAEDAIIGPQGQIRMDTDTNELRVHDGVTPGGNRIPTVDTLPGLIAGPFSAIVTESVPGAMGSDWGKLVTFSVAGTYTLPALSTGNTGNAMLLQATIGGVTVQRAGADLISNQGADVTSLSLTLNEVVQIAKKTAARFIITNRY